jgi:hypothetical protein
MAIRRVRGREPGRQALPRASELAALAPELLADTAIRLGNFAGLDPEAGEIPPTRNVDDTRR